MSLEGTSYAAIHRIAVREARRVELGRALDAVRVATHVVVGVQRNRVVYNYGDARTCVEFAHGLTGVRVEKMTDADRERENSHLCRVIR